MAHVATSIDVQKPVDQVYAQWTQFEDFPKFMENVEEVFIEHRLEPTGKWSGEIRSGQVVKN